MHTRLGLVCNDSEEDKATATLAPLDVPIVLQEGG